MNPRLSSLYYAAVEWDALTWSRALLWLHSQSGIRLKGARVLEIGGRSGALAHWFAVQGASVLSIDPRADEAPVWEFPAPGVVYSMRAGVLDIPPDIEADIVVQKSVLGAIGGGGGVSAQAAACQIMSGALRRVGGEVWVMENLVGSPLHLWLRRRFIPWSGGWRYVAMTELVEFFEGFHCQWRTFGFSGAFGRGEWQRRLLGRGDAWFLEHVVPSRWHYVGALLVCAETVAA